MNTHLQFFEQIKKVQQFLLGNHWTLEEPLSDFYKDGSYNQIRLDGLGALLEKTVLLLHSIELPPDEPIVTIIAKLNDIESALNALQMCYDNFKAEYRQSGDTTEARQAAKNLNDRISDDVFRPFDFNKLVDRLEIYISLKQKHVKDRTCTLNQFMEWNCDIPSDADSNYFDSKRRLLRKCNLPSPLNDHVSGQSHIFRESELLNQWQDYCISCPSLPPLRK
jgi:hypothetical protein